MTLIPNLIEKLGDEFRLLSESLSGEEEDAGERDGELFRSANWVIDSGGGAAGAVIAATNSGDFVLGFTGLELAGGEMLRDTDPVGEPEWFGSDKDEHIEELESLLLVSKSAAGTEAKPRREVDPVPIELPLGE